MGDEKWNTWLRFERRSIGQVVSRRVDQIVEIRWKDRVENYGVVSIVQQRGSDTVLLKAAQDGR